jgi:hypothetical protein
LVFMALCSGARAPLNRPVQRAWNWPLWHRLCRHDCAGNGSLFDRSPSSVPSCELHERSTAGTSQVSKGSAETGAHWPAGSRFTRGRSLHSAAHPQTRQARPAARRGHSKAIPRYQQRSRDCPWIPWAMRWVRPSTHQCSSRSLTGSSPRTAGHRNQEASSSVNRPLPLPRPDRPAQERHRAGPMIADAVLWVPKTCATRADAPPNAIGASRVRRLASQSGQSGRAMILGLWA